MTPYARLLVLTNQLEVARALKQAERVLLLKAEYLAVQAQLGEESHPCHSISLEFALRENRR